MGARRLLPWSVQPASPAVRRRQATTVVVTGCGTTLPHPFGSTWYRNRKLTRVNFGYCGGLCRLTRLSTLSQRSPRPWSTPARSGMRRSPMLSPLGIPARRCGGGGHVSECPVPDDSAGHSPPSRPTSTARSTHRRGQRSADPMVRDLVAVRPRAASPPNRSVSGRNGPQRGFLTLTIVTKG